MKLNPIASNMTELVTTNVRILFSYKTPVAAYHSGQYYKTSKHWSNTTSKHINKWLPCAAIELPQEFFDELANKIDFSYKE